MVVCVLCIEHYGYEAAYGRETWTASQATDGQDMTLLGCGHTSSLTASENV